MKSLLLYLFFAVHFCTDVMSFENVSLNNIHVLLGNVLRVWGYSVVLRNYSTDVINDGAR